MFRIRYKVENGTNGLIEGHVDHLLIRDERSFPLHEGWHRAAPLEGGASYEAEVEFPGLETGRYELWLTLDSQGDYEQGYDELVIGSEAVSGGDAPGGHAARGDRGDGQWAHTYHVTVITKPAPVEPIHAGEPFRIEYEAYNEGGPAEPGDQGLVLHRGSGSDMGELVAPGPAGPGPALLADRGGSRTPRGRRRVRAQVEAGGRQPRPGGRLDGRDAVPAAAGALIRRAGGSDHRTSLRSDPGARRRRRRATGCATGGAW